MSSAAAPVANGLTVDVEDWRQLVHWKMTGEVLPPGPDVVEETDYILETLGARGVRATFFVLANVAQAFPGLVRRLHDARHDVRRHGWSYRLMYWQTRTNSATRRAASAACCSRVLRRRARRPALRPAPPVALRDGVHPAGARERSRRIAPRPSPSGGRGPNPSAPC